MYTHKDIEMRTVFVVNCIEHKRCLRVSTGELLLEEETEDKKKVLTKFPFQKILALFIIGHLTVTTPLVDKCKKYGIALVVLKPNLRPVFYWANYAEANFLLRKQQFLYPTSDLTVAKILMNNKISNQLSLLVRTRRKDSLTLGAVSECESALGKINEASNYDTIMGLEGGAAKAFFNAYFQNHDWKARRPRVKPDELNVTLDIGYTLLFNFMECFIRMFGFDLYVGVYHRLWFKRKSLVCDLMEPFRCIIDHATLLAYNRNQFSKKHFEVIRHEYHLKRDYTALYYSVYFNALIAYKTEIFKYVQNYYRCFMGRKSVKEYPFFEFT